MTYMNDWFFMPLFLFGWLPIIYYMKLGSIPEYFEKRFSREARYIATFMILLYMIGYIAIQFLTLATALYKIYGIPLMLTVVLIALIQYNNLDYNLLLKLEVIYLLSFF